MILFSSLKTVELQWPYEIIYYLTCDLETNQLKVSVHMVIGSTSLLKTLLFSKEKEKNSFP